MQRAKDKGSRLFFFGVMVVLIALAATIHLGCTPSKTVSQGRINGVDILQVYGGGVIRSHATIDSALTAIGTTDKAVIWLSPGTWTISANVDWSSYTNVTIEIPPGAVLSHGAHTILIGGPLKAGLYQLF